MHQAATQSHSRRKRGPITKGKIPQKGGLAMDVICAQCGEPWNYYGIFGGDFKLEEIEPFLKGDYCPYCQHEPDLRTGEFEEEHFISLLEVPDDVENFVKYFPAQYRYLLG